MLFERAGSSPATDTKKAPESQELFCFLLYLAGYFQKIQIMTM